MTTQLNIKKLSSGQWEISNSIGSCKTHDATLIDELDAVLNPDTIQPDEWWYSDPIEYANELIQKEQKKVEKVWTI